jgi:hypothetical protein
VRIGLRVSFSSTAKNGTVDRGLDSSSYTQHTVVVQTDKEGLPGWETERYFGWKGLRGCGVMIGFQTIWAFCGVMNRFPDCIGVLWRDLLNWEVSARLPPAPSVMP